MENINIEDIMAEIREDIRNKGYKDDEIQEKSITGGIYDGVSAILILLAVGALVGTWISGV